MTYMTAGGRISMDLDKWRVHQAAALLSRFWGVYPPGWDLNLSPLLIFPTQPRAFKAAADRADFSTVPTQPTLMGEEYDVET